MVAVSLAVALPPDATAQPADGAVASGARGDPRQAVATYSEMLADPALANDRRAMLLSDRGVAYGRLGQIRLAIEDFNKAVQLFPEFAAIYNNRGSVLLRVGQVKEAVKDFDRAIVLSPGYAAAYNNRAAALVRLGAPEAAIRDFTQAIRLLPGSPAPLSGRGLAHFELGRPHAAIRDFSRAVKLDGSFALGYRNRAEAKLAVGHFEEAVEDLSRGAAFDIANADIYRLRGRAHLLTGDNEAALKDLSRAIELQPTSAHLYALRGLAHGRAGNFDAALADLSRALELEPRNARSLAYRAFVYKEQDQNDVAARDIATALQLDADSADVLWAKAELEEAQGQRDQAVSDLRRAVYLDPSMKIAADALERLDGDARAIEEAGVPGLGIDGWTVLLRGKRYFATNPAFKRLEVPLEMMGPGQPKLIAWEERPPPHRGVGVLTYDGGAIDGAKGEERVELAAIINTWSGTVVAIEPHRQGSKVARWDWNDQGVTVEAVDGVTDEIALAVSRPLASSPARRRYSVSREDSYDPWEQPYARRERARRKPKTLFDLLFN